MQLSYNKTISKQRCENPSKSKRQSIEERRKNKEKEYKFYTKWSYLTIELSHNRDVRIQAQANDKVSNKKIKEKNTNSMPNGAVSKQRDVRVTGRLNQPRLNQRATTFPNCKTE